MSEMPEKQRQLQTAVTMIRVTGGIFMLAAPVIAFDLGGIARAIGIDNDIMGNALGGGLFLAGIMDFFVLPRILLRERK